MAERLLTVSFGQDDPAAITSVKRWAWGQLYVYLTAIPPTVADKAAVGWWTPAEYERPRRHGKYFIARHALAWDIDVADMFALEDVRDFCAGFAHAIHPTFSHSIDKPRYRVALPLSRPVGYDEFQAISRRLGADLGIELLARESHTATQMMYAPSRRADSPPHEAWGCLEGEWIDADAVLARYADWTDRTSWPHRAEHDGVHQKDTAADPREKPGVVGAFCRAFTVSEAIEKFDLPYKPTSVEGRWTYTKGSRPEGAVVYDNDAKLHSHHDSDPAHGQSNAFDLVRLHRFGNLDTDTSLSITQQPSFAAMVRFANDQPEVAKASGLELFDDIGDAPPPDPDAPAPPPKPEGVTQIFLKGSAVVDDNLERVLETLEGLAPAAGLVVYGGRLVRVCENKAGRDADGERVPTISLQTCDAKQLPAMLVGHCRFTRKTTAKGEKEAKTRFVDLPPSLATAIVTKAPAMRRATVDRIACTPLLQDGKLLATPGHDAEHRAWLLTPPDVALGDTSPDGARAALGRLEAWLTEFPFDTPADRGVAMAAILTAAMRASLAHAPGFVVSKPDYGSGASTLCDIINVVLCGAPAPVVNADTGNAEITKTIDGLMLAGAPSIVIDNVVDGQTFNSVALAQLLSQPTRQIRPLGRSDTIGVPCTQMVLVNGNNIMVADDLVRRFVAIRLNPRCESPHKRAFKHPAIVAEAQRARAGILSDCYTVIEAHRLHGDAPSLPLAGFEQWSRTVAGALVWTGYENPIASQAKIERDDPRKSLWRTIMRAWFEVFADRPVTVREVLDQDFTDGATGPVSSRTELHRAITELCIVNGRPASALNVSFGHRLRGMSEKVLNGFIFDGHSKTRDDQVLWRLRRADFAWLD